MAKAKEETASAMHECKACHCPVGDKPMVLPFRADDSNGGYETFCPPCFVHVRGPLEPLRWNIRYFQAIHCSRCGWDSVAVGTMKCLNCGNLWGLLVLPPKVAA